MGNLFNKKKSFIDKMGVDEDIKKKDIQYNIKDDIKDDIKENIEENIEELKNKRIIKIQNLEPIKKYKNNKIDDKNSIATNWYYIDINNCEKLVRPNNKYFDYHLNLVIEDIFNNFKLKRILNCIKNEEIEKINYNIFKFINDYSIEINKENKLVSIYSEYKAKAKYNFNENENKNEIEEKYKNLKYCPDNIFHDSTLVKNKCVDYICKLYENLDFIKYKLYEENIPATEYSNNNNFYMAFYSAYMSHGSIILSPDDIWIQICMNFSKYISEFPEDLRYLFVDHEGKKKLVVVLWEINFKEFAEGILTQIKENTKDNLTDKLSCNFSTSGEFEKFMSNIVIMDCMKHYFEYEMDRGCGIEKVHFHGTLDDWNKLLDKTKNLLKYNLPNNKWKRYIDELIPILKKFIETYNGKKNKNFWNGIIYQEFGSNGYGMEKPGKLSGWLTKFFYGDNENYENIDDIPILNTKVPVEIKFQSLEVRETVNIYAGFSGINEENLVYRPQMSVFIK